MGHTRLSWFRHRLDQTPKYLAAVSLHSHTNHSKESLRFIPKFAAKHPILHWGLERQCKRSKIPVNFEQAYWTPPLTAKLSYEVESGQIENTLGLASLVSLTDHDSIEAPTLLRALPETSSIPFALEWSVPYRGTVFHLGIHNLPDRRAQEITAELAAYTRNPCDRVLLDLMSMLNECSEVLIVFNHPLWDLGGLGPHYRQFVNVFLEHHARFIHAFEINATRSWKENIRVIELAERYAVPVVSGGDRHGCQPSGALNLTGAESFSEFVADVRLDKRSHVLLMPQYAEPRCMHVAREVLDTIRNYPEYPIGTRRWDNRVFHPGRTASDDCALSTLWKAPPPFIKLAFSMLSLLENASVQKAVQHAMREEMHSGVQPEIGYDASTM